MASQVSLVSRIPLVMAALEVAVGAAVKGTADEMAEALRLEMEAPKAGQFYGSHQASAPGEVPADWHGPLKESIASEATGPTSAEYSMGDEGSAYFIEYLEYGSAGGKIAPRPTMHPSVEVAGPLLRQNVAEAVAGVLR